LSFAGWSAEGLAQSFDSQDDLRREIQPFIDRVQTLRAAGDYHGALEADLEALSATALFSDEFLSHIQLQRQLMYDIACYQSLCGDTVSAVSSLQAASAMGWRDYRHALADTDLDPLRGNKYFRAWLDKLKEFDFQYILQSAAPYRSAAVPDTLSFTYQRPGNAALKTLRDRLHLDSVAGDGDEISKIKNLTTFVHELVRHNGSRPNPRPYNGLAFVDSCAYGRGTLNCRGMAMLLNECLLAMDIPSRYITCYPKVMENDCHVINAVWSSQLGKWIWMDPSFNAWVSDDAGNLLGLGEVRARLISGEPLVLNQEANHYDSKTDKAWYLDYYMTKNLYALEANRDNGFGAEDNNLNPYDRRTYFILVPDGFKPGYTNSVCVSDAGWFWQSPQ